MQELKISFCKDTADSKLGLYGKVRISRRIQAAHLLHQVIWVAFTVKDDGKDEGRWTPWVAHAGILVAVAEKQIHLA